MIVTLCSFKGNPCKVQRALSTHWRGWSQARVLGAGSGKGKGRFSCRTLEDFSRDWHVNAEKAKQMVLSSERLSRNS